MEIVNIKGKTENLKKVIEKLKEEEGGTKCMI